MENMYEVMWKKWAPPGANFQQVLQLGDHEEAEVARAVQRAHLTFQDIHESYLERSLLILMDLEVDGSYCY
jgi:hypothetical protein